MTDTQHPPVNTVRDDFNDATASAPQVSRADEKIDWSHLGVMPAHKEQRRERYLRARRRGLWQEGA